MRHLTERHARLPGRRRGRRRGLATFAQALMLLLQLLDDLVKPLTEDELHSIPANVLVLADLVDRYDVGMVQLGSGAGLAVEALTKSDVAEGVSRQHLQGDAPAQRHLFGLIDDAHAAAADLTN